MRSAAGTSMKDGCVKLRDAIRHAISTKIPSTAKIWDALTLGTTEENASTNSYAKINQLADPIATGHPKLRVALSLMFQRANAHSRRRFCRFGTGYGIRTAFAGRNTVDAVSALKSISAGSAAP